VNEKKFKRGLPNGNGQGGESTTAWENGLLRATSMSTQKRGREKRGGEGRDIKRKGNDVKRSLQTKRYNTKDSKRTHFNEVLSDCLTINEISQKYG